MNRLMESIHHYDIMNRRLGKTYNLVELLKSNDKFVLITGNHMQAKNVLKDYKLDSDKVIPLERIGYLKAGKIPLFEIDCLRELYFSMIKADKNNNKKDGL